MVHLRVTTVFTLFSFFHFFIVSLCLTVDVSSVVGAPCMEMWFGLGHLPGESMIQLPGVEWELRAEENGTSADCIIVVVLTDFSHSVHVHARQPSAPNRTCNEFKSCTNLEAWARATRPKFLLLLFQTHVQQCVCPQL